MPAGISFLFSHPDRKRCFFLCFGAILLVKTNFISKERANEYLGKLGFGGYKGFSHESDQLLRSAVELAGNLAAKKPIPATCCWRSCSRITGRSTVSGGQADPGTGGAPSAGREPPRTGFASGSLRPCAGPQAHHGLRHHRGTERAPEPGRAGTSALRHAGG